MKTYTYTFTFIQQSMVDVEAESEQQAKQMIQDMTYDWENVIAVDWSNDDIELQEVTD